MTVSPFDHPWLCDLFGDNEVNGFFAVEATLESMLDYEIALLEALAECGRLSKRDMGEGVTKCLQFTPDLSSIQVATARDGVPVPEYMRQLKDHIGGDLSHYIHFGLTSQDLIDTSLCIALQRSNIVISARLLKVLTALDKSIADFGQAPLMARTRMQTALPIKALDRLQNWRKPLARALTRLEVMGPKLHMLQFGGAVGIRNIFEGDSERIGAFIANKLGLYDPQESWHTARDQLADYASWLSILTGGLGKIGQDICLMAQNGIDEIKLGGGGSSSAMPHKQNPVSAELLVTLARFNASQLAAVHHALIHEQERSGAAWGLEWMSLPQMVAATAAALNHAYRLIGQIKQMGTQV